MAVATIVSLQHSILAVQYPCSTAGLVHHKLQAADAAGDVHHCRRGAQPPALTLCVSVHHALLFLPLVCRKHVVEKVLKLLQRKERWLVVAGVRFLRTCIGTKVNTSHPWAAVL